MDQHVYDLARCIREADANIAPKNRAHYLAADYLASTGRDLLDDVAELAERIGQPATAPKGQAGDLWIVVCRDDREPGSDAPGPFVLATRQTFATMEAAQRWASASAPSREAFVIPGRFNQLRSPLGIPFATPEA